MLYSPSAIRAGSIFDYLDPHRNSYQHCSFAIQPLCIPGQGPLLQEALGAHHSCPGDGLLVEPMWLEPSFCLTSPHYPRHSSRAFYTLCSPGVPKRKPSRELLKGGPVPLQPTCRPKMAGLDTGSLHSRFSSPGFPSPSHNPPVQEVEQLLPPSSHPCSRCCFQAVSHLPAPRSCEC